MRGVCSPCRYIYPIRWEICEIFAELLLIPRTVDTLNPLHLAVDSDYTRHYKVRAVSTCVACLVDMPVLLEYQRPRAILRRNSYTAYCIYHNQFALSSYP